MTRNRIRSINLLGSFNLLIPNMKTPTCNCGTATHAPHETGKHGCERFVVVAPTPAGTHPELGCPMWDVGDADGQPITDYTLRHQRGYHQHEDGTWTRSAGSINSIDA